MFSPLIQKLIHQLCVLPGVGPKSAQRMALHLLENARPSGVSLAESLKETMENVHHCTRCHTLTELEVCNLCTDTTRDDTLLCVVQAPMDISAIEETHVYRGYYFVLNGQISPLRGKGPEDLGIPDKLFSYIDIYHPKEIILATDSTVEGQTTAYYLSQLFTQTKSLKITRLAYGIPLGNGLDYIDSNTLMHALSARNEMLD